MNNEEKVEVLARELKSIIEIINEYYENPEGADIPVDDILGAIERDAHKTLVDLDLD